MISGRVETSASEGEPDSHQERPYVADAPEADVGKSAELSGLIATSSSSLAGQREKNSLATNRSETHNYYGY